MCAWNAVVCVMQLIFGTFSLVACMQPLYGVIFAIVLLNESPTWQTLIGGLLVVSAAVYETVNTHREQRAINKQAAE